MPAQLTRPRLITSMTTMALLSVFHMAMAHVHSIRTYTAFHPCLNAFNTSLCFMHIEN